MGKSTKAKEPKSAAGRSRLKAYRDKRDFKRTTEPRPRVGRDKGSQFVVQKHDARRLHFDLRLELDGVLKSWAVARGPSLVPGVKRLAIETEDHPMEYLDWEGVIPKGEYGGGTMIVWDRGTWTPEGDPAFGLRKGHIQFALHGKRLKGRFDLVRMSKKPGEKKNPWLLIKRTDEFALPADGVEPVDSIMESVVSGRSNADLARRGDLRADHAARARVDKRRRVDLPDIGAIPGTRKGILPPFVQPSLAQLADRPPAGSNWIHEIKFDGYRMQARLDGGKVKLLTRTGLDWTARFPHIAADLRSLAVPSALIDGEIIVQEENGVSSFSGLQADLKSGRHDRMYYMVFDLLYCAGFRLEATSLLHRKGLLESLARALPSESTVRLSEHIATGGGRLLRQACQMGLEGIVSKQADRPHVPGRGEHWIKSKCVLRQEFVIVGYTPSTAVRNAIGSLVLAYYEKGELVHAGRTGTGFSHDLTVELRRTLERLSAKQPKFGNALTAASLRDVKWVKPQLVAEVEYRGWSSDRLLRQSSFKGLREDKSASEIVLETGKVSRPARATADLGGVRLTHPERLLWESEGVTKQGLADFYADIAHWILPHLTYRVLSLVRCPSGVDGKCFYAKHVWEGLDSTVDRVDVGEGKPMLAIRDLRGLMALVQSSVLEIHPWGSRVDALDRPDRLIFDLDPGPDVEWPSVVAAADEIRERLATMRLEAFVKTTGGKGLHVVLPIQPTADWATAKAFTQSLAEAMAHDSPDRYVAVMTKSRRSGRIFVDYLRNGRGATAVAAYSTRARPQPTISVPITWAEMHQGIRPDQFTIENLRQRLDFLKSDPWDGFFRLKQKLPKTR